MSMLGWSAFGSLVAKVVEQSASLAEVLTYTHLAIAVCGAVAGLLAISELKRRAEVRKHGDKGAYDCQVLATQLRFADSRDRLLRVVERLD